MSDTPTPGVSTSAATPSGDVVVVIGRNEGERLRLCLRSVQVHGVDVVYVDSGSTDGSVALAEAMGADVVRLDLSTPFTAARARNAGFARCRRLAPRATHVQFIDGDCEVAAGWLAAAGAFLDARPDVAVVCGRRRERHPERSIYNRLCDEEWDTPIGEALACGGDAMMRIEAFEAAGGYRDSLIAGEEPELCLRLRGQGWKIWRLEAEMTLHDAAITRLSQWWRRSERAGFAFAEGAFLHGAAPVRHWVRETRSAWWWAALVPASVAIGVVVLGPWALAGLLVYPLQLARLMVRDHGPLPIRLARAAFLVLGKFAELQGQCRFHVRRLSRSGPRLIEYK